LSSVVISGDTSGSITIAAPAVSGTNTLTLPANTGTVALTSNPTDITVNSLTVGKGGGSISTNTSFGASALNANTTGSNNIGIGYVASPNNTTGANNTVVGSQALYTNSTGSYNTAIGFQSLNLTTSSYNSAIGYTALAALTSGDGCTSVGYGTLGSLTTGGNSIAIGVNAGKTTATGTYGIFIGQNSTASGSAVNYELVIGNNNSGGVVGKGVNTAYISSNGGNTYNGANTTTWATTSDQRLKKNIVDNTIGLDVITQIKVRNFEYRLPEEVDESLNPNDTVIKEGIQLGVIAQEIQQVLPECVTEQSTGVLSVQTDNLIWYLINSVKELKAELDAVKIELATLKGTE
jgi:hypothetical protein